MAAAIGTWQVGQTIIFTVPSEILIVKYKPLGSRVVWLLETFLLSILGQVLPLLETAIGSYIFLGFALCTILAVIYFYFRMLETKDAESAVLFEKFKSRDYL